MPLRRGQPFTFRPASLSDSADGTSAPPGAMQALTNLYEDPAMEMVWRCRPAAAQLTAFGGLSSPGFISGRLVVGDVEYGLISSARNAGKDEPYAYNLANNTFLTVAGVTSSNVPTSPAATGDWTPPILAMVGSRIVVCHPGFPGGTTKFGWFDVSNAAIHTLANTVSGIAAICGLPNILGVQPGMTITGANIPAGTTVLRTLGPSPEPGLLVGNTVVNSQIVTVTGGFGVLPLAAGVAITGPGIPNGTTVTVGLAGGTISISQAATATTVGVALLVDNTGAAQSPGTFAGQAHGTTTIDGMSATSELFVGMQIYGSGIAAGSIITAVGAFDITLNIATIQTSGIIYFNVTGTIVVLSANATGTANNTAIVISGGTNAAPLWGAGDCDRNPLPSTPLGVAQMAGRAYFACGTDGVPYTDSLLSGRRTSDAQALTTGDGLAATAIAPLLLSAPLTGGIVQGLIVFEGATKMQQISGDQALNTLAINVMPVATGSLSPLSVVPTQRGTAFLSPDGLRFVDFTSKISEVVGLHGHGVSVPMQDALYPSRSCASANVATLRISVVRADGTPGEYWFDLDRGVWSGPHTFPSSLIQPWRSTFVAAPSGILASLWQTDAFAGAASSFIENSTQLTYEFTTVPLPDSGLVAQNALIEATIACRRVDHDTTITLIGRDISGLLLDTLTLAAPAQYRQAPIDPTQPWVFKQLQLTARGDSGLNLRLGGVFLRYQILGYRLDNTDWLLAPDGSIVLDVNGNQVLSP